MKYFLDTGWRDRFGRRILFVDVRRCHSLCQIISSNKSPSEKPFTLHPDRLLPFLLSSPLELRTHGSPDKTEDNDKTEDKDKRSADSTTTTISVPKPRSKLWPAVLSVSVVVDCRGFEVSYFEDKNTITLLLSSILDMIVLSQTIFFERLGILAIWNASSEIQFIWKSLLQPYLSTATIKKTVFCSNSEQLEELLGSDFVNNYR